MSQAVQNVNVLDTNDNVKILSNVLKTNVSACTSIGSFYLPQIGRIFMDMLGLYKAVSGIISETVARDGNIATKTPKIRQLRTVKKEILRLTETYLKRAEDLDAINQNFIPPLFDAILGDYTRNVPQARDAEVLNVMATIVARLGVGFLVRVPFRHLLTLRSPEHPHSSSTAYARRRVRTDTRDDQQGLHRVPGAPRWSLPSAACHQLQLLPWYAAPPSR
jgi:hypothetical protein